MKFERTKVFNLANAIHGMRNPLESHNKSDSYYKYSDISDDCEFIIGKNDIDLAQRLIKAGNEHRKFMRQIFVSVDITAPIYWWKEFDQYKIGVTTNSTSTMHKLASKQITLDCFEIGDFEKETKVFHDEDLTEDYKGNYDTVETHWNQLINILETLRQNYNTTKDKRYWKELIRMLPESWLQTRTVTMNYENVLSMYHQRKNHKLVEWSKDFVQWVESLQYSKELLRGEQ